MNNLVLEELILVRFLLLRSFVGLHMLHMGNNNYILVELGIAEKAKLFFR
ncbi:hypothetical protein Scep_030413 [Stephania cephalantha]|uniref:Uncharacterized protein n=1 Tax=Stephania cephalantha TaxID=152367 RepID=A0AAP0E412_9MAGN